MPKLTDTLNQQRGKRLLELRKAKHMSAQALADAMTQAGAKVSRGAISNWERGINGIVLSKLPTLAHILGCSESYLLVGQTISTPSDKQPRHNTTVTHLATHLTSSQQPYQSVTTQPPINSENTTMPNTVLKKSTKLQNVCYDIRGPLLQTATKMEEEGHKIIKLNIGNPAPFGFEAPQEILSDVAKNLPKAIGYSDSKGIFAARKAILQYYQAKGLLDATNVNDVYLGNGVSELIVMTMQALLNNGDEVLVPMPDYPLWTAATNLAGGSAVHYVCDETNDWQPNINDIKCKITAHTRAIVVINPNNPTGSVYSQDLLQQIVQVAKEHNLIIMADEIYDRVLYDDAVHVPLSTLTKDCLVMTFNGLSKSHRIAGFRAGWMMLSGKKRHASDFIEGLDMLSSMRLCANVQAQYAIQTALGGYQSMQALTTAGGRLYEQRNLAVTRLNAIKGVSCVMPKGAMYCFPRLDPNVYPIENDTQFMMDLLIQEKVLMVQGTGFNWQAPDHFRLVFLPAVGELKDALTRLERFLAKKRAEFGTA